MEEYSIGTLETDCASIRYFKAGKGKRALVLIPGMGLHSAVPMAASVAAAYSMYLEEYTLWLFDRREDLPAGFTIREMAEDEAMALEAAGIREADVLGCSMGGMIGIVLAAEHPELVRQMTLASTLCCQNRLSRATFDRWIRLGEEGDAVAVNRDFAKRVYSPSYYEKYKPAFLQQESLGTPEEMRHFVAEAAACRGFDGRAELEKIRARVMVTGAWNDRVLSGKASVQIASRLRCALTMDAENGHAAFDEAPDFKERLYDFFTKDNP